MQQVIEWGFRLVVLGIAVWAVKGFINEKTTPKDPGKQLINLCYLKKYCKEYRTETVENMENDMGHVRELIEKDLERGQERFGTLDTRLDSLEKKYEANSLTLAKILGNIERLVDNAQMPNHSI